MVRIACRDVEHAIGSEQQPTAVVVQSGRQIVQEDRYLLTLCRYIALNPVRSGLTARPEEWLWSSYAAIAGLRPGTPDNAPIVGPGGLEGLVLASGHFRNGILLAPLTAQGVVAVALRRVGTRHGARWW